jgi:hypothetical protein
LWRAHLDGADTRLRSYVACVLRVACFRARCVGSGGIIIKVPQIRFARARRWINPCRR